MKKLILFDIDGTLIKTSKEHKKSFSYAFKKVHNIEASIDLIDYHGKTDQQIIKEVLIKKGLKKYFKLKECMNEMVSYMKKHKINIKLIKGVKKLIHKLEKKHILGLVTGNFEQIAIKKLKQVEIYNYFKLGGFGSDAIKRSDIVKIAIKRAKKKFTFNEVFVIGDTPNDIIAGKEANVKTIAVATGIYSINELKKHNPDYVFENLNNDEIIKILTK
ncbi:MAG: HAD family hydrolase [Candidatus Woesearchaeota archaeon]